MPDNFYLEDYGEYVPPIHNSRDCSDYVVVVCFQKKNDIKEYTLFFYSERKGKFLQSLIEDAQKLNESIEVGKLFPFSWTELRIFTGMDMHGNELNRVAFLLKDKPTGDDLFAIDIPGSILRPVFGSNNYKHITFPSDQISLNFGESGSEPYLTIDLRKFRGHSLNY